MKHTIIFNLTDSNFQEKISQNFSDIFLVDFWAEWCHPCKTMTLILETIASEYENKLKIAKLNIDENPLITKHYNIKSIPTLLLIQNNMVLSTKIGLLSKQQLKEFLDSYIKVNHI